MLKETKCFVNPFWSFTSLVIQIIHVEKLITVLTLYHNNIMLHNALSLESSNLQIFYQQLEACVNLYHIHLSVVYGLRDILIQI